jgi:hypothetical protein
VNFESIIVSLSSSHEYFPLVKLVGHIKVRHSARCVHVCAVRSLPDEAIWRFPYYLSLKKSLPFFKRRWNNRNNSGIISGIISESDSSIIPIPSGLWRLSQAQVQDPHPGRKTGHSRESLLSHVTWARVLGTASLLLTWCERATSGLGV